MRPRTRTFAFLWLFLLSTQCVQSKPRFGMLFQMNKPGEKVVDSAGAAASDKEDDVVMEPVCIDQAVLQAQLEHAKNRLLEKEQEASQVQAKLAKQLEELRQRLAEAETQTKPKAISKHQEEAPSGSTLQDDTDSRLASQDVELESSLKTENEAVSKRLEQAQSDLETSKNMVADLQGQIDEYVKQLEDIHTQHEDELSKWNLAKHDLTEKAKLLDQALQAATQDQKTAAELLQKAKEDAVFWESTFHHRSYINVTHLADFTDVLLTTMTAPLVESARGAYQAYFKDAWETTRDIGHSTIERHLTPFYETHIAPLYDRHAAPWVATGKEKATEAWREFPSVISKLWTVVVDFLVRRLESFCRAGLESVRDSEKRDKIQRMCDDPTPFVMTLLALPVIILVGRLLFWLLILPLKLLLLLSPVRFSGLENQDEQPESVSANVKSERIEG